ncbi:MAG: tRNA pseudouridine(13) synthase TruD [Nanoarchaeota archaeon]|nr:tRNA pseudouridine(13) synthase TruD [Nanoarchaeota archaeon]
MIIKREPSHFRVDELYDLKQLQEEKGVGGNYAYFLFTKINLSGQKAIVFLAQKLSINSKRIHFCGTKDKVAITTQLISIQNCSEQKAFEFVELLNSQSEDMKLEHVGQFNNRLNLSNNLGNRFEIILEEVSEEEKEKFMKKEKEKENETENETENEFKVFNFFQTQRFGICKNTHKIGLLLIKNQIKNALFEILLSLPQNIDDEEEIVKINSYITLIEEIKTNFEELSQEELKIKYPEVKEVLPQFLRGYLSIINHLINTPKDVSGAFRTLPKKLRTLYIHAFQSAIFNKHLLHIKDRLNNLNLNLKGDENIKSIEKISLVGFDMDSSSIGFEKNIELLKELDLKVEDLQLKHMPELQLFAIEKEIFSIVKNYTCEEIDSNTLKISFDLQTGSYATQVISEISEEEEIIRF